MENGDQVTKGRDVCVPKILGGVFTPKILGGGNYPKDSRGGVITPRILGGGVSNPNNPP